MLVHTFISVLSFLVTFEAKVASFWQPPDSLRKHDRPEGRVAVWGVKKIIRWEACNYSIAIIQRLHHINYYLIFYLVFGLRNNGQVLLNYTLPNIIDTHSDNSDY